MTDSGNRTDNTWVFGTCVCPLCYAWNRTRWSYFSIVKCQLLELQITTCDENGKIQSTPKISKLYVQVKSCLPNSTMVGHLFVDFLFAMTLLSSLGIRKLTHWLFPIYVHSERVCSSVFQFIQWMSTFLYYDPDRFACVRIPTQIQINITIQI